MDCTRAGYMQEEVNKAQRILNEYERLRKLESKLTEYIRLLSLVTDNTNMRVKTVVVNNSKTPERIEIEFDRADKDFLKGMCYLLNDYKARTIFNIVNL